MANKTHTIYDVAKLSGVSISTVSRVLNAPSKVNSETRIRVIRAIDDLGFVPKAEARARALQQTGRIGVITPFFTAPSFVQRLRGIANALGNTNHELVIYTVDSKSRLEGYLSSLPLTGNLDGLIIVSLEIGGQEAKRLLDHGLQTVLIEYPHDMLNSVEIDDIQGGRMAAQYLIKKGHRRLAFLGDTNLTEYSIHPVSLRLTGFRQALQEAGLSLPDTSVYLAPYTKEQTHKVAKQLLEQANRPTAIFSATDFQALGIIKVAQEMGIQIPKDMAVIGFDDLDLAEYTNLTTIRQHLDESGHLAVDILLAHIADPTRPAQHVKIPLEIIERQTA